MKIIPAIDLLEGKVVRLLKGKRNSAKVYSTDPVRIAGEWVSQGAQVLHIVDLDASFGTGNNLDVIAKCAALDVLIQVGGGIRTVQRARELRDIGVDRLIIGTKAVDAHFLERLNTMFPGKVMVGVDVLDNKVMLSGWTQGSDVEFIPFITLLQKQGIEWIIYTDISRDGTLTGPDIERARQLETARKVKVIVSGGVGSIDDLYTIKKKLPFVYGVITGKALYEQMLDFSRAVSIFQGKEEEKQ